MVQKFVGNYKYFKYRIEQLLWSQTKITLNKISAVLLQFNLTDRLFLNSYNPGQNLLRQIAKMPIFSCHPGKN